MYPEEHKMSMIQRVLSAKEKEDSKEIAESKKADTNKPLELQLVDSIRFLKFTKII